MNELENRGLFIYEPQSKAIADAISNARDKTMPLGQAIRLPAHQSIVKGERKKPQLDEVIIECGYHCSVWFEEHFIGLVRCLRIYIESDVPWAVPTKLAMAHLALAFGILELHSVWMEEYAPQKFAIILAAKSERL
jgi:hypothetical protein